MVDATFSSTFRTENGGTLGNHSKERDQAEARFDKVRKVTGHAGGAAAQYEADGQAVREKTARLKALRLAKEAADLETRTEDNPAVLKKIPHPDR